MTRYTRENIMFTVPKRTARLRRGNNVLNGASGGEAPPDPLLSRISNLLVTRNVKSGVRHLRRSLKVIDQ